MCFIAEQKEKQCFQLIIYTINGHLPTKVTSDTDFTDERVVQMDVPVVNITFADACK